MRLDHIAYRVADRFKAAKRLENIFHYEIAEEFCIPFKNGEAKCLALRPQEQLYQMQQRFAGVVIGGAPDFTSVLGFPGIIKPDNTAVYHLAPEIFVSEGTPNSVVGKWVADRKGIGGIHHLAYEVPYVQYTMHHLSELDIEFTEDKPIESESGDLVQIFTVEDPILGIIYEFIERRGNRGFNVDNVKRLMLSTDEREELAP